MTRYHRAMAKYIEGPIGKSSLDRHRKPKMSTTEPEVEITFERKGMAKRFQTAITTHRFIGYNHSFIYVFEARHILAVRCFNPSGCSALARGRPPPERRTHPPGRCINLIYYPNNKNTTFRSYRLVSLLNIILNII